MATLATLGIQNPQQMIPQAPTVQGAGRTANFGGGSVGSGIDMNDPWTRDFYNYFSTATPGSKQEWGGGTMEMLNPTDSGLWQAQFTDPTGATQRFDASSTRSQLENANPYMKAMWDKTYNTPTMTGTTGSVANPSGGVNGGGNVTPMPSTPVPAPGTQAPGSTVGGSTSTGGLGGDYGYWSQKLKGYYDNPDSFKMNPAYQSMYDLGLDAINRTAAAKGMLGSGNRLYELQGYGNKLANQAWNTEFGNIAGLMQQQGNLNLGQQQQNTNDMSSMWNAKNNYTNAQTNMWNTLGGMGNANWNNDMTWLGQLSGLGKGNAGSVGGSVGKGNDYSSYNAGQILSKLLGL